MYRFRRRGDRAGKQSMRQLLALKCGSPRCSSPYFPCSRITHTARQCGRRKEGLYSKGHARTPSVSMGSVRHCAETTWKSAVTRSGRNEPVINPDFEAFCRALRMRREVPARCAASRDKSTLVKKRGQADAAFWRMACVWREWCSMTWSRLWLTTLRIFGRSSMRAT